MIHQYLRQMNNLKYINIGENIGGVLERNGQGSTEERLGVSQKMGYYPRGDSSGSKGGQQDKDCIGSKNSVRIKCG